MNTNKRNKDVHAKVMPQKIEVYEIYQRIPVYNLLELLRFY